MHGFGSSNYLKWQTEQTSASLLTAIGNATDPGAASPRQAGCSPSPFTLAPQYSGAAAETFRMPSAGDVFYAGAANGREHRVDDLFSFEDGRDNDELDLLESIPDIEALFEVISGGHGMQLRVCQWCFGVQQERCPHKYQHDFYHLLLCNDLPALCNQRSMLTSGAQRCPSRHGELIACSANAQSHGVPG